MNILKNSKVYLAGPIEQSNDSKSWRDKISSALSDLEIESWDPLKKPQWFNEMCGGELTAEDQRNHKHVLNDLFKNDNNVSSGFYDALNQNCIIRMVCLKLVSACDFVICKVGGPTVGTFEELSICSQQDKPILFLYDEGETLDSCWRAVQFANSSWFNNINDLIKYVTDISNETIKVDKLQWIFLPGAWPNASKITN